MAGYGVPDELDGVLAWDWAEARLAGSRNFWLSTVAADGRPHSLPVWGVWIPETERFFFSCAPSARKTRNIAANDRVVVTNDDAMYVVSLEGRAAAVDPADIEATGRAYQAKYAAEPMFDDVDFVLGFLRENAAFEVTPERAFGIIETPEDFGPRATK